MSCLFKSLSFFTTNENENSLRQIICDYLETNPVLIDDIKFNKLIKISNSISSKNYIEQMRNPSSFGGGIEIKAFCDLFEVGVAVHNKGKFIKFLPKNNKSKNFCLINYINDNHYEKISKNELNRFLGNK